MTTAILVAFASTASHQPACLLPCKGETILGRLIRQLEQQGVDSITIVTRSAWQWSLANEVDGIAVQAVDSLPATLEAIGDLGAKEAQTVLLAHADIIVHDSVIDGLLADPRVPSGVLSSTRQPAETHCPRLRLVRGRIVAAESAFHAVAKPTHAFLGLCKVTGADRESLVEVARELRGLTEATLPPEWEPELARKVSRWGTDFFRQHAGVRALADQLEHVPRTDPWLPDPRAIREDLGARFETAVVRPAAALREDPISLCLTGLVRRDVVLTSTYLRDLLWARPLTEAAAQQAAVALDGVDEDKALLNSAVKSSDGFFTTFFVSPYSKYIARWCAHRGLTPNQVTIFSMLLGILAALAFAGGTRAGLISGAVLLQLAFTADCVDGQLARYTRQFSKLGAWLDSVFDRGKEYVVYAGLAWGATATGAGEGIWVLAAAALTLQTVRHFIDFGYAGQQHQRMRTSAHPPLTTSRDRPADAAGTRGAPAPSPPVDDMVEATHSLPHSPADGGRGSSLRTAVRGQTIRLSARLEHRAWLRWAKRIIVLPIGERFALISLTAAIANARVTFIALLLWGTVAAVYTLSGRALRSLA